MTRQSIPQPGTALPWVASDDHTCKIIGTADASICEMHDWPMEFWEEQETNAAYIVAACNSFPVLVEALEWIEKIADVNYEQDEELRAQGARTLARIASKARAALSLALGEQT